MQGIKSSPDTTAGFFIFKGKFPTCAEAVRGKVKIADACGEWCGEKKRPLQIVFCKDLKFMARSARFELTAFGSGGQRSIQLSYERTRGLLIASRPVAVKSRQLCFPQLFYRIRLSCRQHGGMTKQRIFHSTIWMDS